MIGRDKLFVCWLEAAPEAIPDLRERDLNTCRSQLEAGAEQLTPEAGELVRAQAQRRRAFPSASTRRNLPLPSVRNHKFGEPCLVRKTMPVYPRCGLDQLPAPIQQAVAQLDDP